MASLFTLLAQTAPEEESSGGLIDVVPGLMIWTLIAFGITFFVLKRFAFGAVEDHRRPARADPDGARGGRPGARGGRQLLEQHRSPDRRRHESARSWPRRKVSDRAAAREGGGRGGASAPPRGDAPPDRGRDGAAIDQIRAEVADLTVEATQRVVGKVLDSADQRRLIDEAIEDLDFSALERGRG